MPRKKYRLSEQWRTLTNECFGFKGQSGRLLASTSTNSASGRYRRGRSWAEGSWDCTMLWNRTPNREKNSATLGGARSNKGIGKNPTPTKQTPRIGWGAGSPFSGLKLLRASRCLPSLDAETLGTHHDRAERRWDGVRRNGTSGFKKTSSNLGSVRNGVYRPKTMPVLSVPWKIFW